MRIQRPKDPKKMQPPMTPMIDCTFNLLIFFLLTPSFSGEAYLTTNLPKTSGPSMMKTVPEDRIKIELYDVSSTGEYVDGGKNEFVSIIMNDRNFGSNFGMLRSALADLWSRGLKPDYPVLISPTMGTRNKWVVQAFDAAVAARFTNIQFAVPYE